jgi:DNA-binding YbaB/EbfC family protein
MQPGGQPDMNQIMQQAMQMQQQLQQAQQQIESTVVEGSAGGGLVTVSMTGGGDVQSVTIDPKIVDPDDVESLQDLVVAALRDANAASKKLAQDMMGPLAGGLSLPGM